MKIGIPKETKIGETRVALTPEAVEALVREGHDVSIQSGAGDKASFGDDAYTAVGCRLVNSADAIWKESEVVVKVKEPQVTEYQYLRKDLLLVSYLHLAGEPELTKAMLKSEITSFAYELYHDSTGQLPLLKPMSQVAGRLSIVVGSHLLLAPQGGRGLLLGGASGVKRGKVTIVGAGAAGKAAAELAVGQGAEVIIFERSPRAIEAIENQFGASVQVLYSSPTLLNRELIDTDLLIGAVLVPGARAPRVISREQIKKMPKGSVFIDISIDQGGCGETSRPTTHAEPTYVEEGVLHYGVCNIPALAPRTSALALSNAIMPFISEISSGNWSERLRYALCTDKGSITHPAVRDSFA